MGSGGGSSDEKDSEERQRILKKRKFKDFVKYQTGNKQVYSGSEDGYGDEKKLFKILEHERLKKSKYNHASVISAPVYADFDANGMPGIGYTQR